MKKLNFDGSNHDSHRWRKKLKVHLARIIGINISEMISILRITVNDSRKIEEGTSDS